MIARTQLLGGTVLADEGITVTGLVPPGHKVATRAIAAGEAVRRYDQIIGHATQAIAPGQHVHTHNFAFAEFPRDHEPGAGRRPRAYAQPPATFDGHRAARRPHRDAQLHRRADLRQLLGHRRARDRRPVPARRHPEMLAPFPNVDGVVALTHGMGCATDSEGEELQVLRRTLGGYARHPNFAAVLVVGPGLRDQPDQGAGRRRKGCRKAPRWSPSTSRTPAAPRKTVARGVALIKQLLPEPTRCSASRCRPATSRSACNAAAATATRASAPTRRSAPRSTAWCATAAPAILSETPEIYGGEHLLTRRAVSREVAERAAHAHQLVGGLHRAQRHARWTTTRRPATRPAG